MTTYALIGPGDVVVRTEANIDPKTGTKPGYRWVEVVEEPVAHNEATQVVIGPETIIEATRLIRRWSVRDKTAEELAAEADHRKERELDGLPASVFRVLLNHENRIRTLESRQQVTAEQFRAALKALINGETFGIGGGGSARP